MFIFQTAQDNIDLQTTILSRFDLIFIVKDIRMYAQDKVQNYLRHPLQLENISLHNYICSYM